MDVNIELHWKLSLTTEEFRLVLKALGLRLNEDEANEAEILGDRLGEIRAAATGTTLRQADKLLSNIHNKTNTG
jgi:hypothetical protein